MKLLTKILFIISVSYYPIDCLTFHHHIKYSHRTINKNHNKNTKCEGSQCPPFGRLIPQIGDINNHPYKPKNEGTARLGCGAYKEEDVKHLKMKVIKPVNSLYYDNMDLSVHEADGPQAAPNTVYYDPSQEIYGDSVICNQIKNPYICVSQCICGWCGSDQKCILGTIEKPKQDCTNNTTTGNTYTYNSYVGWDPYSKVFPPVKPDISKQQLCAPTNPSINPPNRFMKNGGIMQIDIDGNQAKQKLIQVNQDKRKRRKKKRI